MVSQVECMCPKQCTVSGKTDCDSICVKSEQPTYNASIVDIDSFELSNSEEYTAGH